MSYEREAIPDSITPNSPTPAITMKSEERVIDPYRASALSQLMAKQATPSSSPIGQSSPGEGVATEATQSTEEAVKLSPQVASIARREQRFRQKQMQENQRLAREKAALEADRAEIAQFKAFKQKLAAKDYSGLDELGVDYNEYSQFKVNQLNGSDPVAERMKMLENKIGSLEKNTQESVAKQFEYAVQERKMAVDQLLNTSPEYPRIKKANATQAVVQHILDTWEHDNQELTVEQAAKEVEQELTARAKKWSELLQDEAQSEGSTSQEQGASAPLPPMKKPQMRTLTNAVTASESSTPRKSLYGLSDQERWAEARRRAEARMQQK